MDGIECSECEKPLSGGIDTFGLIGYELCQECFLNDGLVTGKVNCPVCRGKGEIPHNCDCDLCDTSDEECKRCEGTGWLFFEDISPGEFEHMLRAVDLSQLEKEKSRLAQWNSMVLATA